MSYRLITPKQKRSFWGQVAVDCAWCEREYVENNNNNTKGNQK